MAFVPFTEAETDFKAALREAFLKKMKDDFDDHESRIIGVEGISKSQFFTHFLTAVPSTSDAFDLFSLLEILQAHNSGGVPLTFGHSLTEHAFFATWNQSDARGFGINIGMRQRLNYLPKLITRIKINDYNLLTRLHVGIFVTHAYNVAVTEGIYLEVDNAATDSFIFRTTKAGAGTTSGSPFTGAADGNYFEVEFEATASDVVVCKYDGTTRATFGPGEANLPAAATKMFPMVGVQKDSTAGTLEFDWDRILAAVSSVVDL